MTDFLNENGFVIVVAFITTGYAVLVSYILYHENLELAEKKRKKKKKR
jgi:hypothetical protein